MRRMWREFCSPFAPIGTRSRRRAPACAAFAISLVSLVFGFGASADDYAQEWAPPIGSILPPLAAPDHTGTQRTLDDLAGDQGLLIFLNRSADW